VGIKKEHRGGALTGTLVLLQLLVDCIAGLSVTIGFHKVLNYSLMGDWLSQRQSHHDNSILLSSPMIAGEGNPQAREEEGKLYLLSMEHISSWNSQNVGIGIPWESHCFHFVYNSLPTSLIEAMILPPFVGTVFVINLPIGFKILSLTFDAASLKKPPIFEKKLILLLRDS